MLKVGNRVSKQIEIGEPTRHYGIIIEVYKSTQGLNYTPMNMYAVKWDDIEIVQREYFGEYLQKEK